MDTAELYMTLVRPNMVPIVGECLADPPFTGQIQIEKWNWTLNNDDEIQRAKDDEEGYEAHREMLAKQPSVDLRKRLAEVSRVNAASAANKRRKSMRDDYEKSKEGVTDKGKLAKIESDYKKETDAFDLETYKAAARAEKEFRQLSEDLTSEERKRYRDIEKMVGAAEDDAEDLNRQIEAKDKAAEIKNKSYEFSFSKRVDFATTQMLNSMKAGDVFPTAVLTIYQRSSNAGMGLVITVTKLRLLDYSVRADVSETMTDMKEQWKAEFQALAYVYKNRKIIDGLGTAGEAAAKIATQNTVRTFAMKKTLDF